MPPKKISWTIFEYEHKDHTNDWFWALGIIAVAGSVAAFIHKNYLLAIIILFGIILLFILSLRRPREIEVEINEKGIVIDDLLYPYKNLKSFYVTEEKVLVRAERFLLPIITLHFNKLISPEEVKEYLKKYLPEEEMEEPFLTKLLEVLGF